jgi:hypothetical protein
MKVGDQIFAAAHDPVRFRGRSAPAQCRFRFQECGVDRIGAGAFHAVQASTIARAPALERKHWAAVFANKDFVEGFASKFRPLVMTQEVKLLTAAPWGPHP